jgi:NIMA (never in mitosis gene a)-related kinase
MGDEYRQIRLLGQGAFGKCYLVESKNDNSKWVLKQIDIHSMSEEEKKEALKEAKILKAFDHPNIIKCTDAYTTKNGKLCIVMEYADGGDLQKKIKDQRGKLFQEVQIIDWLVQLCLSLKHVHDRKILHRDIKCQNVFLTKDDIVKLGDFGIARVLGNTRENARTMVGTPYYLSPEIVENKPYNFKSDVWSLGVLLYELCTLKPPFDASSLHFLALKIVRGVYPPLPPHYSRDLKTLVKQMLSIDPGRRPTIAQILRMPFIKSRIQKFLSETIISDEFSHTVLHHENALDKKIRQDKPVAPPIINPGPVKKPTPKDSRDKPGQILPPKDLYIPHKPETRQEPRPVPGVPSSALDKKPIPILDYKPLEQPPVYAPKPVEKPAPVIDYKVLEQPPVYVPKPVPGPAIAPKPTPYNLDPNLPRQPAYPSVPAYNPSKPPSNLQDYNIPKHYPKPYNEPEVLLSEIVKPSPKVKEGRAEGKWGRFSQDFPKKEKVSKPAPKAKRKSVDNVKPVPKLDKKNDTLLKKKIEDARKKKELEERKLEEAKLEKAKEKVEREQQRNLDRQKMLQDIKNKKKAAKSTAPEVEWFGMPKSLSTDEQKSLPKSVEQSKVYENNLPKPSSLNAHSKELKPEPPKHHEPRAKKPRIVEDKVKEDVVVERSDGFEIYYSKAQIEKARMIAELRNEVEQEEDESEEPGIYTIIQEVSEEDLDREDMIETTPIIDLEDSASTASTEVPAEPIIQPPTHSNHTASEEPSGFSKLELLRWYLEEKLGANALVNAYHVVKRYADSENENWTYEDCYPELAGIIQESKIKEYTPLVHTLIIMEEYAEGNR